MPKKSKQNPQVVSSQPLQQPTPPTISSTVPKEVAEWDVKNARAKEIIMSTLIPGSEPWKIAEPLEFASDIWKALEERYAPKEDSPIQRMNKEASVDFVSAWVDGKSVDDYKTTSGKADQIRNDSKQIEDEKIAIRKLGDVKITETSVSPIFTDDVKKNTINDHSKKAAQAAAARYLVEKMPNRDQRFLWALLHGGKEEIMDWFNGTPR